MPDVRQINLEEYRASGTLQDLQAGAPLNAFNRDSSIRHAQLGTWWERGLAVLSLAFALVTLTNLLRRSLWP
jgi:hypothetical protein